MRRVRVCRKKDRKTGEICGQPHFSGGLCEEHYRKWASRQNSRFQSGRRSGQGGVITCVVCGKRTRETGHNEGAHEMCKKCIRASEILNSFSDGSLTEDEYRDAIARLEAGEDV